MICRIKKIPSEVAETAQKVKLYLLELGISANVLIEIGRNLDFKSIHVRCMRWKKERDQDKAVFLTLDEENELIRNLKLKFDLDFRA